PVVAVAPPARPVVPPPLLLALVVAPVLPAVVPLLPLPTGAPVVPPAGVDLLPLAGSSSAPPLGPLCTAGVLVVSGAAPVSGCKGAPAGAEFECAAVPNAVELAVTCEAFPGESAGELEPAGPTSVRAGGGAGTPALPA